MFNFCLIQNAVIGESVKVPKGQTARERRRLAAIMFTDMAGYTALGQRNETLSLVLVNEQRKLLRPIFKRHHGREIKTIGDAFLTEFPSALDATRCAYDIQRATREFNFSLEDDKRIHLRVGVHLGDVIESKDGDISGDAVNVASRIEPLAEHGGVCLTRQVFDHIENKFDLPLESIGYKSLKNVRALIEVYRMVMPWEQQQKLTEGMKSAKSETEGSVLDPLRIAVLPFSSLSPDPSDEYFADGITEELITRISLVAGVEVIARTSSMTYKKKDKKISEVAKELKIGTLVEGSVRKAGNRIRVTAQLINARTEAHLWADNYDRDLNDIFEVQSSVAENVANALKVRLLDDGRTRLEKRGPKNPEVYEDYLKGLYFAHKFDEENNRKSIRHLERAVELEPGYPQAMAVLGAQYVYMGWAGYDPMEETIKKGKQLIIRALQIDEQIPEGHFAMGQLGHFLERNWPMAEREYKRALELNPNFSEVHCLYAQFLASLGRTEEAMGEIRKALDLDPLSPLVHEFAGTIFSRAGLHPEALRHFQTVNQMDPNMGHGGLGFALLQMGRNEDAIKELEKALEIGRSSSDRGDLGYAYAITGRKEDALRMALEIKATSKKGGASRALASIYAGLGEKDKALDWLEKAYDEQVLGPGFQVSITLSSLRDEPRFKKLVKKMGIPK